MGSRVRVSSGPPTKEKRGFDIFETSFVFMLFHLQKIWLFASCSVRRPPDYWQSKSVYCELCQITERFYAKSPNFQIIDYFCRCEHFEIKYLYIQCYSADSLLTQIVLFISQKPFRLPFLRLIMPFSVRLFVMVLWCQTGVSQIAVYRSPILNATIVKQSYLLGVLPDSNISI